MRRIRITNSGPDKLAYEIRFLGFKLDDLNQGRLVEEIVCLVNIVGNKIVIGPLEGITVAYDYTKAIINFDRGFETSRLLKPSEDFVTGIGMTLNVKRNGKFKKHVFVRLQEFLGILEEDIEISSRAKYTLAHELCHVAFGNEFCRCFPEYVSFETDAIQYFRWSAINACWDEYSACYLSAQLISNSPKYFKDTFVEFLSKADSLIDAAFMQYRNGKSNEWEMGEIFTICTRLLELASYCLGDINGKNGNIDETGKIILYEWFKPYYYELNSICSEIMDTYGNWKSLDAFYKIGDLIEKLVLEKGLSIARLPDGGLRVNISR